MEGCLWPCAAARLTLTLTLALPLPLPLTLTLTLTLSLALTLTLTLALTLTPPRCAAARRRVARQDAVQQADGRAAHVQQLDTGRECARATDARGSRAAARLSEGHRRHTKTPTPNPNTNTKPNPTPNPNPNPNQATTAIHGSLLLAVLLHQEETVKASAGRRTPHDGGEALPPSSDGVADRI